MDNDFALDENSNAVIEDIKAGLQAAFDQRDISISANESAELWDANVKIQKLAYRVIEHFEIPVIRTWYRYGQFEPYGTLRPEHVTPKPLSEGGKHVPSNKHDDLTREEIKGYYLEIDELEEEWKQPLFEFLRQNYEKEEEREFRDVYLANLGILEVLEEVKSDPNLHDNASKHAEDLQSHSIDLWYEMKEASYFGTDETEFVRDFLDDLQVSLVTLAATDDPSGPQISTIREGWAKYHEKVWPWPAMKISMQEADGPKKELRNEFLPEGEEYLNIFERSFPEAVNSWQQQLRQVDLVSGPTTYQSVKGKTPRSLGSLERAVINGSLNDSK